MMPSVNASPLPFVNRFYNQAMYTRQCLTHQVSLISQSCLSNRMEKSFSPAKASLTKAVPFSNTTIKKSLNYKLTMVQASEILNLRVLPRVFIVSVTPGVELYARP